MRLSQSLHTDLAALPSANLIDFADFYLQDYSNLTRQFTIDSDMHTNMH
jgi:hypothetical protein